MKAVHWLVAAAAVMAMRPALGQGLPPFPAASAGDTYFGVRVDDPYRALESLRDAKVLEWMKAQDAHTRRTLEGLEGYARLRSRLAELDSATEANVGDVRRQSDGTLFFLRRGVSEDSFKLFMKPPGGADVLVADPDEWRKATGKPHAINYYYPSLDGRYVALGVSASGSEDASLYVIEAATRKRLGEPIDRAEYAGAHAGIAWLPDGESFLYLRLEPPRAGAAANARYLGMKLWKHRVGQPPETDVAILGPGLSPRVPVAPAEQATVVITPGSRHALALVVADVQREVSLYAAPVETAGEPGAPWVKVCDVADKVTGFTVRGDDLYLLSYAASPRYSILRTALSRPDLRAAATVVAASEKVIFDLAAARDALYYESRDGAVKRLMRLAWGAKEATEVRFAVEGAASLLSTAPVVDGAIVGVTAWTRGREIYAVDGSGRAANTGLQPLGRFGAPEGLVTTEVRVKSHDGALVPLSIIHRRDVKLDGRNPTLLYGYGAYGITEEPRFSARSLAWLEQGGVYAIANVRGSGVYGKDWHHGGFKATKPNTWKDFIACAEYLIAQNYTVPAHLGILGGSAGGILVGRALTERPDLFAAAVPAVGVLDAVRSEVEPNGVLNVPEFGTVAREDEFRALLAMSSYHHVRDGVRYPGVLLPHGVNDPRVSVWHSTKMAARLQAATASGRPVLLDLDFESGHGIGDTRAQRQRQAADIYAFLLWQMGQAGFQPAKR